jgi:hypothetical protein
MLRRTLISAAGVLVIASGLWGCGKAGAPGAAPPADDFPAAAAAAIAAEPKFEALAAGSSQVGGHAPRLTDPAAGPLLEAIFNTKVLATAAPPKFDNIDPVENWLKASIKAGQVFILAGTGATDPHQVADNEDLQVAVAHNMSGYAPEVGRYFDTQIGLMNLQLRSVSAELAANPAIAQTPGGQRGLTNIRAGTLQSAGGAVTALITPGLTDEWRIARMGPLIAMAPAAAKMLTPEQKAQLAGIAKEVSDNSESAELKAKLAAFAAAVNAPA